MAGHLGLRAVVSKQRGVLLAWFGLVVVSVPLAVVAAGWPSSGVWLERGIRAGILLTVRFLVVIHYLAERRVRKVPIQSPAVPVVLREPLGFAGLVVATVVVGGIIAAITVTPLRATGVIGMNVNDAAAACLMFAPCFALGLLCGRWWAFMGGVPVLLLGLFGVALEGGAWVSVLDWSASVAALAAAGALTRFLSEHDRRRMLTLAVGMAVGFLLFLGSGLIIEA